MSALNIISVKLMDEEKKEVEKKEADKAADPNASEDEKKKALEEKEKADETAKEGGADPKTNEVDYEAELVIERGRREGAEQKIVDLKRKAKEDKDDKDDKDDKPDIDIATLVEEKVNAKLQENTSDLLENVLTDITNEKERALVKYHYENSIKPTGFTVLAIQKDVARARLIANEKKLEQENSEMKIALKAKHSVGNAGMGSNQDKQVFEDEPKYSEADKKLMKRHGLTPKDIKKD